MERNIYESFGHPTLNRIQLFILVNNEWRETKNVYVNNNENAVK